MNNWKKNIIVGSAAVTALGIAFFLLWRWDKSVLESMPRREYNYDSTAFRPTAAEQRIAQQFSDSILPQLKRLGLITKYNRTDAQTHIAVSGVIWKKRSPFFKESILDQIFIYNKVNGFTVKTLIVDDTTNQLYAQISPPDRKNIY
jgi:hypothetical protein